jgi:hypothetical protein
MNSVVHIVELRVFGFFLQGRERFVTNGLLDFELSLTTDGAVKVEEIIFEKIRLMN